MFVAKRFLEKELAMFGNLGASWVALGPSWDRLGAVLGRLWAVLGIFGAVLGLHRSHCLGGVPPPGLTSKQVY